MFARNLWRLLGRHGTNRLILTLQPSSPIPINNTNAVMIGIVIIQKLWPKFELGKEHGLGAKGTYNTSVWRPEDISKKFIPWIHVGEVIHTWDTSYVRVYSRSKQSIPTTARKWSRLLLGVVLKNKALVSSFTFLPLHSTYITSLIS